MRPGPRTPGEAGVVALCAALADDTRWEILRRLGRRSSTASELATELPVTRQAIARHLAVLAEVGLVDPVREGRAVRYRALGQQLARLATDLDTIGRGWEMRLDRIKELAEERSGD